MIRTLYFKLVEYNIAVLSNKAFTIYFIYLFTKKLWIENKRRDI